MVIHDASDLRQSLSDELHARAFYDFEGAGRFIRFVYLIGNDDSTILNYVNDYLQTRALALMQAALVRSRSSSETHTTPSSTNTTSSFLLLLVCCSSSTFR